MTKLSRAQKIKAREKRTSGGLKNSSEIFNRMVDMTEWKHSALMMPLNAGKDSVLRMQTKHA
jgi:hypothetical protein